MSKENPASPIGWVEKLETLETIHDQPFNRGAAWDRLHARLDGKKPRRRIFWYWIAAASVILVLSMIGVKILRTEGFRPVDRKLPGIVRKAMPAPVNVQDPAKENIPALSIASRQIPGTANKNVRLSFRHPAASVLTNPGAAITGLSSPRTDLSLPGAPTLVVFTSPAKPRLNVAHINELGDPVNETLDISRRYDKHSVKIKLGSEEVYVNSSIKSPNSASITINPVSN